jgi:hypothetical protein
MNGVQWGPVPDPHGIIKFLKLLEIYVLDLRHYWTYITEPAIW